MPSYLVALRVPYNFNPPANALPYAVEAPVALAPNLREHLLCAVGAPQGKGNELHCTLSRKYTPEHKNSVHVDLLTPLYRGETTAPPH